MVSGHEDVCIRMTMSPAVKTLLLDADGVVQTTSPGWLERLADLCGVAGGRGDFLRDVFAAEKPALTGEAEFKPALAAVLERWRSPASLEEAIRVWQMIQPQTWILDQVTELRQNGIRVSLATNQQAERAAYMSGTLGYSVQFDDLFFSCELGHAKPQPAYFEAVRDRLDLPGSAVLFVDDHPDNVSAARAMGLRAAVFELDSGPGAFRALMAEHGLMAG
jgi:putative hydrolase of the HAD superfamily